MANEEYQRLLRLPGGRAARASARRGRRRAAICERLIGELDDAELVGARSAISAGHDLADLLAAFRQAEQIDAIARR